MRGQRIGRSVALTFAGEAASVLATVWVTRRVALSWASQVAGWLVLRQVLGWMLNVGLVGLGVALPRALAVEACGRARRRLLSAALLLALPALALVVAIGAVLPRAAAVLVLRDEGATALVRAASVLVGAHALFAIAAAALQGLDRFGALAFGRTVAFGLVPPVVVAALAGGASLPRVVAIWGLGVLAVDAALGALAWMSVGRGCDRHADEVTFVGAGRRLLAYGGLRMLGGVAQLGWVAAAPTVALWSGADPMTAAALSVGWMFAVVFAPVNLALKPVALTHLAQAAGAPRASTLGRDFFAAAAGSAAAFAGALSASGDRVVTLWMGPAFARTAWIVALAVPAVALQFFCHALEGVLDADDGRQRRPRAQLVAAAVFALASVLCVGLRAGALGVVAAQVLTATLQTVLYVRQVRARYGLPQLRELLHGALTLGAGCCAVGLLLRRAFGPGLSGTALVVSGQLAAALAALALARAAGVRWLGVLLGQATEQSPPAADEPASAARSAGGL